MGDQQHHNLDDVMDVDWIAKLVCEEGGGLPHAQHSVHELQEQ